MSDYIPLELLSNILARLSMADVLRSTSVCKSWYNLITSPSFISLHLNSSISNTQSRIMVGFTSRHSTDHYYVHGDNQTFEEIHELKPLPNPNVRITIHGSSNGVFCCYNSEGLVLWNPSLKKSLILPRFRGEEHSVGFGFLPKSNNFKIVRLTYTRNSDSIITIPPEVEIYEFNKGFWRDLNAAELSYVLEFEKAQALLNGIVHWTAHDQHKVEGVIVSFDLTSEKFKALMLPKCLQNAESVHTSYVCTVKESLCLFHYDVLYHVDACICSVFVMKEYGVTESWEKVFMFDKPRFKPLYIRENGEILGELIDEEAEKQSLGSYDPKIHEIIDLGVHEDAWFFMDYVYAYVDSLFLI